jgi:hypothetical protein
MEKFKFYKGDPLVRLLIDRLHLSPGAFALVWTLVVFGIGFFASLASGTLISTPEQVGFLQDIYGWIWNLGITPLLAGYYLWGANAIAGLLQGLQKSEVVQISDEEISGLVRTYQQPWRTFLSLGIALVVGILFFTAREDVQGYERATDLARYGITLTFMVGTYTVSMLVFNLVTNIWALRRILRDKEFHVNPLHPDRCGGLKALSQYSLKIAYLVAGFGFVIGLSEYRYITQGMAQEYWIMHLGIPVYFVIATASFFAPLNAAHDGMKEAKKKLLENIARQFWNDYSLAQNGLSKDADSIQADVSKIQQLQTLYEMTEKFPVWPFDVNTLQRFIASVTSPIIAILLGWLSDFIQSLIFPPS